MNRLWLVLTLATTSAQARPLEQDFEYWHLLALQSEVGDHALAYLELQPRLSDTRALLLMRSAFGWRVVDKLSLWGGYAAIPTWDWSDPTPNINETRFYEQLQFSHRVGRVDVLSRTRLEQRIFAGAPALAHRIRTLLRTAVDLGTQSGWALAIWDEVFFHLNSVTGLTQAGFDQNRGFVGLSYRVSSPLTFEFGYMNIYTRQPLAASDRMSHVLFTSTMFRY